MPRLMPYACPCLIMLLWGLALPVCQAEEAVWKNLYLQAGTGVTPVYFKAEGRARLDDTLLSGRLGAGYHLTTTWALEADYTDYQTGDGQAEVRVSGGPDLILRDQLEFESLMISLVGDWDIGERLYLQGRGGLGFWRTEETLAGAGTDSDTELEPFLGVGLRFELVDHMSLVLDGRFTVLRPDHFSSDAKANLANWTLAFRYDF